MRRAFLFLPGVARSVQPGIQPQGKFLRITPVRTPAQTTPAESALAAPASEADKNAWNGGSVEYTYGKDAYGNYVIDESQSFGVVSFSDAFGAVDPSEYTVLYFEDNDGTEGLTAGDDIVAGGESVTSVAGGMPDFSSTAYANALQKGNIAFNVVIMKKSTIPAGFKPTDGNKWSTWSTKGGEAIVYHADRFTVTPVKKSLEGAALYGLDTQDNIDESKDSAVYTGNGIVLGVSVDGEKLKAADYTAKLISQPKNGGFNTRGDNIVLDSSVVAQDGNNAQAGAYTFVLVGKGAYAGTQATVSYTVESVDLATADVPTLVEKADGAAFAAKKAIDFTYNKNEVNQTVGAFTSTTSTLLYWQDADGEVSEIPPTNNEPGRYTYQLTAPAENQNVKGTRTVTVELVEDEAYITYDGAAFGADRLFDASRGQAFDPELFEAWTDSDMMQEIEGATVVVTKGGEVVTDFTEPGDYTATVTVPTAADFSMGGSQDFDFTVVAKRISSASNLKVMAAVDGTVLQAKPAANPVEYDAEAVVPTIVVKDGTKTLVAGEDYTVAYEDKDGNEVESVIEPGMYAVVVSFPGTKYADGSKVEDVEYTITVEKAEIESAEATADFFALPADGAAVSPTFVGYVNDDLTGASYELAADQVSVSYYAVDFDKANGKDAQGNPTDDVLSQDEAKEAMATLGTTESQVKEVAAADLDEAGWYVASINVLTTAPYIQGTGIVAPFQLSASAAYADVDANAWYAESVYTAASEGFGYMTGIPGTNLFLPEGQITRAQVAQVLYNMAGGNLDPSQTYPTQFSDVEADAWYAAPIFWASQAGIVTGIGDTGTFAPNDPVTREQVATMLWRYMKAQGKDVSGAADLAAYADGSSVSGWAAEAMAWAVDAEVFGVGTDVLRPQDDMSRAEMAATAVRVQPDGAIVRS